MIHLFHGFLGHPDDLKFFELFGQTKSYDLKTFDENEFEASADDVLVGYSMGGRVALKLAAKLEYKIKKVIILSSNPNSLTPSERQSRLVWEEKTKNDMLTLSSSEFFRSWNALGIFKNDLPIPEISREKLQIWAQVFEKYRLSDQADYLQDLKNHPDKFAWIVGDLDEKYLNIAKTSGVKYYTINAGHRLFQRPQEITKIIKEHNLI